MPERTQDPEAAKTDDKNSVRLNSRRKSLITAFVALVLIVFVVVTSLAPVSKLTITFVNYSFEEVQVAILVDDFKPKRFVLQPNESVTCSWDLRAWVHKYDIVAHQTGWLANWFYTWTYIVVLPFYHMVITDM